MAACCSSCGGSQADAAYGAMKWGSTACGGGVSPFWRVARAVHEVATARSMGVAMHDIPIAAAQVAGQLNSATSGALGPGAALRPLGAPTPGAAGAGLDDRPSHEPFVPGRTDPVGSLPGGRIYAQERRGQAGSVPGQTNPAGTLPGGHVYAQEDEKKDPKPGPTVETPGDKPGDSTSVPSQRVFCCCLLVDLKIIVKEDPIVRNKPEQAGEVAHVVVRITFSWRKDPKLTKNLPCILQWWEYTDNPYPPATKGRATLRKNTWTDLSKNQRGLAQVFPPWTSAMGGGTEEGEQKIECLDQSREIVMTDEVRFPGGAYADATIKDRPSFPGLDRLESSRSLSGVVRVFSGCPNGPKSSKAWHVGNSHYWYDTNFQGRKGWPALPKGETSSPFPNSEQVLWPKPPGETPLTPTTKYVDNPPNVGKPPANPPSDQATAPDPDRQGQPTTAGPGTVASPEQQAQSNLPDSDDR